MYWILNWTLWIGCIVRPHRSRRKNSIFNPNNHCLHRWNENTYNDSSDGKIYLCALERHSHKNRRSVSAVNKTTARWMKTHMLKTNFRFQSVSFLFIILPSIEIHLVFTASQPYTNTSIEARASLQPLTRLTYIGIHNFESIHKQIESYTLSQ